MTIEFLFLNRITSNLILNLINNIQYCVRNENFIFQHLTYIQASDHNNTSGSLYTNVVHIEISGLLLNIFS